MEVIIPKSVGFCHGVKKTLLLADKVIKDSKDLGIPCYCIGKLIHNPKVVSAFKEKGLNLISSVEEIHKDIKSALVLISAHGCANSVKKTITERGFEFTDGSCVNIRRTQKKILDALKHNRAVIVLGIEGHSETVTLMGTSEDDMNVFLVYDDISLKNVIQKIPDSKSVTVVCQTTFPPSLFEKYSSEIKLAIKDTEIVDSICNICIKRMNSYKKFASETDAVMVIGSKNSENTKNMASFLSDFNSNVYLIEDVSDLSDSNVKNELSRFKKVLLCSGTSTPLDEVLTVSDNLILV